MKFLQILAVLLILTGCCTNKNITKINNLQYKFVDIRTTVDELDYTEIVKGVECKVIRCRFELDGLLMKDIYSYYTEDMKLVGQYIINYKYDLKGYEIDRNTEESW